MNICKSAKYVKDYINYYYLFGIGLKAIDKRSSIHDSFNLIYNDNIIICKCMSFYSDTSRYF